MGDYHFPALIHLIWIRTKNSTSVSGGVFPLHHKAYQQLIYITMELQQPPDSMKLSAYGTGERTRTFRLMILNHSPMPFGYTGIWWKEVFHLLQRASPRSRTTPLPIGLITRGFYYEVHHSYPISLCLSLFLIGLLPTVGD